jgi:hypothetical protein
MIKENNLYHRNNGDGCSESSAMFHGTECQCDSRKSRTATDFAASQAKSRLQPRNFADLRYGPDQFANSPLRILAPRALVHSIGLAELPHPLFNRTEQSQVKFVFGVERC